MKHWKTLSGWWLNLPIRLKGMIIIVMPVVVLLATMIIRVPLTRQQAETTHLLAEASQRRDDTHQLMIALLDLETAARGYMLTRERSFLTPFDAAGPRLPALMIQSLTPAAARLAEHRIALARELVRLADAGVASDTPEVRALLREGKQTMDDLRAALAAMHAEHNRRIAASRADLNRLDDRLRPIVQLTLFGGLFVALIAAWLFATGIVDRVKALERNAGRLARGERLLHEPSRGGDEIGSLDSALRRASILQRTRERELRGVNQQLEHTVREQAVLNRELEAFSYSVSHDLRAPLRSIDGFAQALREDWGDRLDAAGQDHLARVRNAAQRMGRLIDDLLKLSKLARAPVQRVEVDLSGLALEIAAELRERNPTRQVAWSIADGLRAWCDPALARIAIANLLGNAWKFTIGTEAAHIEFTVMPATEPAVFVVRDNGAGFDMQYAHRLFGPFQRLHTEREFPGTGIGLATTQRIVHKHGGRIRAHGVPGRGATFYFTMEADPSGASPLIKDQVPERGARTGAPAARSLRGSVGMARRDENVEHA